MATGSTARVWSVGAVLCLGLAAGWRSMPVERVHAQGGAADVEWRSHGFDAAETRYSPAAEIDVSNASRLGVAWSAPIGDGGASQEATLIVADGTIYGITTWSVTVAVDARTGQQRWRWDPEVDRSIDAQGSDRICCGVVNRGVAVSNGRVFVPVIDGRLVALDAATGRPIWTTQATPEGDIAYTLTMAPRVVGDVVIVGNSGAEFPPYRGYFSAFDVATGAERWRFYTVPGDPSKPFENPALERAAKTWTGEWWKYGGGGSVWDSLAYDAEADLIYVGTGNGAPWPMAHREQTREMDNLYVASILALRPATGELVWHYQAVPGDQWDYDATQQLTLAELRIDGRDRKVVMQANKNGFFYVLDRLTGEFISGDPFTRVNWTTGLDATGRPRIAPEAYYGTDAVAIAPSGGGAHNWAPMAFSPTTGLVYFPATLGSTFAYAQIPEFQFTPGAMNLGLALGRGRGRGAALPTPPMIGPEGQGPHLVAWDPVAKTARWRQPGGGGIGGGVLVTAGGVVFQAVSDGRLLAYAADSGDKLLELPLGPRGVGPPITYTVDGTQYVALIVPGPPRIVAFKVDGEPLP